MVPYYFWCSGSKDAYNFFATILKMLRYQLFRCLLAFYSKYCCRKFYVSILCTKGKHILPEVAF